MFEKLRQNFRDANRCRHIISVFAEEGLGHIFEDIKLNWRVRLRSKLKARLRKKRYASRSNKDMAVRMRRAFERLGPTFIKFGQILSVRPDLLPKEYSDELEKLQNSVAPVPFNEIKKQIRSELGKPIKKVFNSFEKKPVATASLAQAHKATLKNGNAALVKVQRLNIEQQMKSDMRILAFIAKLMANADKYKYLNLPRIIEEFEDWTLKELDFELEASYTERFAKNFRDDKNIVVPCVYRDYSSKKVLTFEYINGFPLNEFLAGKNPPFKVDRYKIARLGLDSFIRQTVIDGFFHADPHPGNLFILEGSRLAYLDFGMMGVLDKKTQKDFMEFVLYISKKDTVKAADKIVSIGKPEAFVNIPELRADLHKLAENWYSKKLKDEGVAHVFYKMIRLCASHEVILPAKFSMLGKAIFTYDGIARDIFPTIVVDEELKPIIKKYLAQKVSVVGAIKDILKNPEKYLLLLDRIPDVVDAVDKIESDNLYVHLAPEELTALQRSLSSRKTYRSFGIMSFGVALAGGFLLLNHKTKLLEVSQNNAIFVAAGIFAFFLLLSMFLLRR